MSNNESVLQKIVRGVKGVSKGKSKGSFRVLASATLISTVLVSSVSALAAGGETGNLKIGGSTTVQPIAQGIANSLKSLNPGLTITVEGGGSGAGISGLASGQLNIGCISRDLTAAEKTANPDFVSTQIGSDAIAVIMNNSNPVVNLTKQQVKDIFTGTISNWSQVGGSNAPIVIETRETASGTLASFKELALSNGAVVSAAVVNSSSTAMKAAVSKNVNAIGFDSFGYIDETVKAVSIDAIACTYANATSKTWPYIRSLNLITRGTPTGLTDLFVSYALREAGQQIVKNLDYLPLSTKVLRVGGSTTVQPIAQEVANALKTLNSGLTVTVEGGGSGTGVSGLASGRFDIGCISRDLTAAEKTANPDFVATQIGLDAISVIINNSNTVNNLTKQQVKDIFTGAITNWSQVGGSNAPIVVETREATSGTLTSFKEIALGNSAVVSTAVVNNSSTAMKAAVSGNINAIGFDSFGYVDSTVKAVSVEGVACTYANATNKTWPYIRSLNLITKGAPSGLIDLFIGLTLREAGQQIVKNLDYLPLTTKLLRVGGSTTVQPISQEIANVLMPLNAGITIKVEGGGTGVGISGLASGLFDIGCISRELTIAEKTANPTFVSTQIGSDAISVILNNSNPVANLTKQQVKDIFTGVITNWSQVGGNNAPIIIETREAGSGTLTSFQELALSKAAVIDTAIVNNTSTAMKVAVSGNVNAIGFDSFGYVDTTVKAVSIEGVACTYANATNKTWPYIRSLNLITKGAPAGLTKTFVDYALSTAGQQIVKNMDYLPLGSSVIVKWGDADGNGVVGTGDLSLVKRVIGKPSTAISYKYGFLAGDVDCNGKWTTSDLSAIKRKIVGGASATFAKDLNKNGIIDDGTSVVIVK